MNDSNSGPSFQNDILIVAYRRFENLRVILGACLATKSRHIYVSIDGPPTDASFNIREDIRKVKDLAFETQRHFPERISIVAHQSNVGSRVNMISAIDWAFATSEELVILEDDCIPTDVFFGYVDRGLRYLKASSDIWAISGTQHNSQIEHDGWYLTSYFQVWGWATTQERWREIKSAVFEPRNLNSLNLKAHSKISHAEKSYWSAGSRRALKGYVDAWDTPITSYMRLNGKYSIAPTKNLVSNLGNDQAALHVNSSRWTRIAEDNYLLPDTPPVPNDILDAWTRSNFYQIRFRHIFSTRLRQLLDLGRGSHFYKFIKSGRLRNFY